MWPVFNSWLHPKPPASYDLASPLRSGCDFPCSTLARPFLLLHLTSPQVNQRQRRKAKASGTSYQTTPHQCVCTENCPRAAAASFPVPREGACGARGGTGSWSLGSGEIQDVATELVLEGQGKHLQVGTLRSDYLLLLTAPDIMLDKTEMDVQAIDCFS